MNSKVKSRGAYGRRYPESYWITCHWCRRNFEKDGRRYRESIAKGRTEFFCSDVCSARWRIWQINAVATANVVFQRQVARYRGRRLGLTQSDVAEAAKIKRCAKGHEIIPGETARCRQCRSERWFAEKLKRKGVA